jgi:hypothetical protein
MNWARSTPLIRWLVRSPSDVSMTMAMEFFTSLVIDVIRLPRLRLSTILSRMGFNTRVSHTLNGEKPIIASMGPSRLRTGAECKSVAKLTSNVSLPSCFATHAWPSQDAESLMDNRMRSALASIGNLMCVLPHMIWRQCASSGCV